MPDNLQVKILVDGSELASGMKVASSTVQQGSDAMMSAFAELTAAVKESTLAMRELGSESAPALRRVRQASEEAGFSVTEARHALHGFGEEVGIHVPRFVQSFVANLGGVGPALAAAFAPIAVIGLAEVLKDATERLTELISKTFIYTEAAQKLYDEQLKGNQTILAAEKQHEELLREISLIGLSAVEQARLRAQWSQDDLKSAQQAANQKREELISERQKLELLRQQKEEQIASAPESSVAPLSDAFDKSIEEAEIKIQQLNLELGTMQKNLQVTGDEATITGKRLGDASEKARQKLIDDQQNEIDATVAMAERDLKDFEDRERKKALFAIDMAQSVQKAETQILAERAKENAEFDRNIEEEEKKLDEEITRSNRQRLERAVQDNKKELEEEKALAKQREKPWGDLFSSVNRNMESMIKGVITGTQSVSTAFASMGVGILTSTAEWLAKVLAKHAEHWLLVNVINKNALAQSLTDFITETTAKQAVQATADSGAVISDAGVAGAAAFASVMSALPFPANVAAAPGVMADAIGTTLSNLSLTSAAGGMWQVPGDQLAMIHKNESILPAGIAGGMRDFFSGGAVGGAETHVHFHVNATDARGVEDFFKRNEASLVKTLRRAVRKSNG